MPVDFATPRNQSVTEFRATSTVADVPLTRRDDFKRLVTLFIKRHRVRDLLNGAGEVTRLFQQLSNFLTSSERGLTSKLAVHLGGVSLCGTRNPFGNLATQAPVTGHHGTRREVQFTPPRDVGEVTKRTHHGNTCTLIRLSEFVSLDLNLNTEQWRHNGRTKKPLVTLIVGVGHKRHNCWNELWARRQNDNRLTRGVGQAIGSGGEELDLVVRAFLLAVLELSLRNRSPKCHIPHGGGVLRVRLPRL